MKELICIVCPKGCHLKVDEDNGYAVAGSGCPRGAEYGKRELTHPTRVITSTVRCRGGAYPRCPVKTSGPIPKERIFEAVALLEEVDYPADHVVNSSAQALVHILKLHRRAAAEEIGGLLL